MIHPIIIRFTLIFKTISATGCLLHCAFIPCFNHHILVWCFRLVGCFHSCLQNKNKQNFCQCRKMFSSSRSFSHQLARGVYSGTISQLNNLHANILKSFIQEFPMVGWPSRDDQTLTSCMAFFFNNSLIIL